MGTSYTPGLGNRTLIVEGVLAVAGGGDDVIAAAVVAGVIVAIAVGVVVAVEVVVVDVVVVVVVVVADVVVVVVALVLQVSSPVNSDSGIRLESNSINSVLWRFVGTDDTNTTHGQRFAHPMYP